MLLGSGIRPVATPVVKSVCAIALLGLAGAATAPAAQAQAGGASSLSSPQPAIATIACLTGCPAPGTVERGGTVTLGGQGLDRASSVVFLGARGSKDDARVAVRATDAARLDVKVPATARSGQVVIATTAGVAAQSKAVSIKVVRATSPVSATLPAPTLAPVAGVAQLDAGVATLKAGKGASAAAIAFVSHAAAPVAVRIDVVRLEDGVSIFDVTRTAAPEQRQSLTWEGKGSVAGAVALDGRYEVRIAAGPVAGARTVSAGSGAAAIGGAAPEGSPPPADSTRIGAFTFVGAVFPVTGGKYNFGQGAAAFGAGRSGHSHEGQDVMTACGTPIVAAQGGVVKQKAVQSNAGNYVVIGSTASGEDNMYAHFRTPAVVARGARVQTGQLLGYAGDTGSATACHLHFEIWTAPGWYSGGQPIDPLPTLKAWEKLG